jgi:hypothetical protein
MIKILPSVEVELIREREFAGLIEFIGQYTIQRRNPTPFRLIGKQEIASLKFEPPLRPSHYVYDEIIKELVLKQSNK